LRDSSIPSCRRGPPTSRPRAPTTSTHRTPSAAAPNHPRSHRIRGENDHVLDPVRKRPPPAATAAASSARQATGCPIPPTAPGPARHERASNSATAPAFTSSGANRLVVPGTTRFKRKVAPAADQATLVHAQQAGTYATPGAGRKSPDRVGRTLRNRSSNPAPTFRPGEAVRAKACRRSRGARRMNGTSTEGGGGGRQPSGTSGHRTEETGDGGGQAARRRPPRRGESRTHSIARRPVGGPFHPTHPEAQGTRRARRPRSPRLMRIARPIIWWKPADVGPPGLRGHSAGHRVAVDGGRPTRTSRATPRRAPSSILVPHAAP